MVWASDEVGRDGRPAVLLLAAARLTNGVMAELGYVAADLPPGPLAGTFTDAGGASTPVRLSWPGGWPKVGLTNRLHPNVGTPPAAKYARGLFILEVSDGEEDQHEEE